MKIELHLTDEEIYYLLGYSKEWTLTINTNRIPKEEIKSALDYVLDQIKRQWESKRR